MWPTLRRKLFFLLLFRGVGPPEALAVWGDPTVLFRMSLDNLVELGKNKLKAHGFLGTIKKIVSNA